MGREPSAGSHYEYAIETPLRRNVLPEVDSSVNSSVPPNGGDILEGALRRARWTIFCERLWPPIAAVVIAIGIFLAVPWLGLWLWLPRIGRAIALAGSWG
jgi:hypothetical protein